MLMLVKVSATVLLLVLTVGVLLALGALLGWQQHAATSSERIQRLLSGVLPTAGVLLSLLLAAFVWVALLWSAQGPEYVPISWQ
ncbi:hypothetical protein FHG12_12970 [Hymenobacter jejuensis]|uniref:Uncharacterized protein n=2 Tax=Hymenobacter jejuensis TaxID=2502781 RepID=A0A5B8A1G1_9BACT|nr:hypothetical protein FHG12_12970 [Hymenobacter jejuensis]